MKRNYRLLISIILIISLNIGQYFFYNASQEIEEVSINEGYMDPFDDDWNINIWRKISIVKSRSTNLENSPAVILLHGDSVNSKFMNHIKLEFLRNDYIVVLIEVSNYGLDDLILLNSTVNYLLNQTYIDHDRIGVVGHSHGGHYATLLSIIRNETIKGVICGNPGGFDFWYDDYYEYLRNIVLQNSSLPYSYQIYMDMGYNLTLPMNLSSHNNFLLISDDLDQRIFPQEPEELLKNFTEGLYDQRNELYGSFSDGSARKLLVTTSIFAHGSSLYNPTAICEEIKWMNNALDIEENKSNKQTVILAVSFGFGTLIMSIFLALAVASMAISYISKQDMYVKIIKDKITTYWNTFLEKKDISGYPVGKIREEEQVYMYDDDSKEKEQKDKEIPNNENESKKPINTIVVTEQNKLREILKYLLIAVVFTNLWFLILHYLPNSVVHDVAYFIEDFPEEVLKLFGIYLSSSLLNNYFPYDYMFFWTLIILAINYKIFAKDNKPNSYLRNLKAVDGIKSFIIATEVFGISYIFIDLAIKRFLGDFLSATSVSGLIYTTIILFSLNFYISKIFKSKGFESKGEYLKEVIIGWILFIIPLLGKIMILTVWGYYYVYSYVVFGLGFLVIAILNPILRTKEINALSITMFDILLLKFITTLL
ncbi:MAG: prolyl oligopeptidase family serine peptidase [Candidatus Lokiarchaeota archaeon]|nr:prolyl oligopeptidase family serine peptidase [Candidatus Lokiarchaeota archaeon]